MKTPKAEAKLPRSIDYRGAKEFRTLTLAEKAALEKQKSNSTSTMYVQSTISVPDVDRILLSVGLLLEQMITEPPDGPDPFNPPPTLDAQYPTKRPIENCRASNVSGTREGKIDLFLSYSTLALYPRSSTS